MIVHTADSAIRAAALAPYLWVRSADAARLRLGEPWVRGHSDKVNGEEAVVFKHPLRELAVIHYMDGDPLTWPEAVYLRRAGYA
jgi:hypothetical protein